MLRSLLASLEVWVVAVILSVACATLPPETSPGTWAAEVVAVRTTVSSTGEPVCEVTIAWEQDAVYEQRTVIFPFGSREAMLRVGQHVHVANDRDHWLKVIAAE